MKKLSKNTFAKLFATFLGASTILTPLVTIVSCQPISKSPTIEQTKKQPNKDNKKTNPGTPNPTPNPGTPDPTPNPGTPDPTDPLKDINTTEVNVNNQKKYILSGSFNIDDITTLEEKITNYEKTGSIEITSLNINCFSIKPEGVKTQSITSRNVAPSTISYVSKTIKPQILKDVLSLKGIKDNTLLTLNNNGTISIPFESSKTDYFDITDLAKFRFSDNFKITEDSVIFLRAERKLDMPGTEDNTKYAKTTELLSLVNNPKIKHKITVGKVQLRGNVKDLLPLLVEGPNKIKEADGGITFGKAFETPCTGENWTGYNGIVNDNGNVNNTGRSILKAEEFLELKKRSGGKQTYVRNAIITDLDSKNLSPEQLENAQFDHDILTNVNFKNSDLSKIQMKFLTASVGTLTFENTTLPLSMMKSVVGELILKNVTFPKEEFNKNTEYDFSDLPYNTPMITDNLTIYGEIKDSPLKDLTQEQIEKLKNDPRRPNEMPGIYKGSQEIYDRLKYIYRGESHTKEFGNLQGSIQKPQDTFLALLGKNNARG